MVTRSRSRFFIIIATLPFSLPTRFPSGTRQLSNTSSLVGDARMPILENFLPVEKPGMPRSIRNVEMSWRRVPVRA